VANKSLSWQAVRSGNFDGSLSYLASDLEDGYEVIIGLERNEDGVLQCLFFSIEWKDKKHLPYQNLNSRYLQTLGFGDLLASARTAYAEWGEIVREVYDDMEVDRILADWKSFGSTAIPDKFYAAIAFKYENFVYQGLDNPISALAEFLGTDRATVSSRVVEARNRGLLTKPKEGNFGGRLTSKGKQELGIEEKKNAKKKQ
jgi:hypothetical protein